jgi:hypothetical protein
MTLRLWLWLLALDAIALCGGYGSRLFLWCVSKASDADPPGEGVKLGEGDPF